MYIIGEPRAFQIRFNFAVYEGDLNISASTIFGTHWTVRFAQSGGVVRTVLLIKIGTLMRNYAYYMLPVPSVFMLENE